MEKNKNRKKIKQNTKKTVKGLDIDKGNKMKSENPEKIEKTEEKELSKFEKLENAFSGSEKDDKKYYCNLKEKLDFLALSDEALNIYLEELKLEEEYEKKLDISIFTPVIKNVGLPVSLIVITAWFNKVQEKDFLDSLVILAAVFCILYVTIGGIVYTIMLVIKLFKRKKNRKIRFLQKYINEKRIEETK